MLSHLQVTLHPDPPVLGPNSTTTLEVRYRPLLVGSSDAVLRLDSQKILRGWTEILFAITFEV